MLRLVLSSLRANARRLISTSIAVCLGVALLAGTMVLGDTLKANFADMFQSSFGNADAVVRSANTLDTDGEFAQDLIDGSLADSLAATDGVAAVVPQIEGFGQLTGADGEKLGGNGPPTLAGNWIDDPELNPFELVEGRAPATADEVVINRGAAKDGDLAVGDTTTVATPEPVEVTIVGIATFGGADGLGPTTFTGFSLAGAEEHITGRPGEVTSLLVRADSGTTEDELVDRIAASAPDDVEVISGTELVQEANDDIDADFLGVLRIFLTVFALVALLVATFSINNTFTIIAAQRQRSSALLRAIGGDRRQVLLSMVGESVLVGVVASVVGVVVGLGLAQGLKALFDAFGFALPAGGMTLQLSTLLIAPIVGLTVTLLASLAPAVRASRVSPLAALRDVEVDRSATSPVRAVVGGLLLVGGIVALVVGASGGQLGLAGLGAALTVGGVVALGPIAARPVGFVLGTPVARLRGIPGALARRNAVRTPRRTAATASALMVGIGVVTIFTVFAGSLKASVDDNVGAVVKGDLVIATSAFGGGGMSPGIVEAIDAVPEVDHAVGVGSGPVSINGRTRQVTVFDPTQSAGTLEPEAVEGSVAELGVRPARRRPVAGRRQRLDDRDHPAGPLHRRHDRRARGRGHLRELDHAAAADHPGGDLERPPGAEHHQPRGDLAGRRRRRRVRPVCRRGGDHAVRRTRRADDRRVHRRGHVEGEPDARPHLRHARPRDHHRPDGHRQHACRCRSTSGSASSACSGPSGPTGRRCVRWCGGSRSSSPSSARSAASASACSSAGAWCRRPTAATSRSRSPRR